jgi:hypothetical protein
MCHWEACENLLRITLGEKFMVVYGGLWMAGKSGVLPLAIEGDGSGTNGTTRPSLADKPKHHYFINQKIHGGIKRS